MMGSGSFDSSFKEFADTRSHQSHLSIGSVGVGLEYDSNALDTFIIEVDKVKDDIKTMETIYNTLEESNEEVKVATSAKTMMEIRTRIDTALEHVLRLAKQINKKLDGLVRTNAAQRKVQGYGPGSNDEQHRASMIAELGECVNNLMRQFQGLRVRMEADQRHVIEDRFTGITGDKVTEEAIDHLVSSRGADGSLYQAMQEHGTAVVLDAINEIQERRDAMREIRRNLMNLHQILLGMASPVVVEPQGGGIPGGGFVGGNLPSPVEVCVQQPPQQPPAAAATAPTHTTVKPGGGRLNDYEKETRRQAYIAMGIALVLSIMIIFLYLHFEDKQNKETP